VDDYQHSECVTALRWWESRSSYSSSTTYNLLSLSSDGKILLWEVQLDPQKRARLLAYPSKGFLLLGMDAAALPLGGLCFDTNPSIRNMCVVGTETGGVMRVDLSDLGMEKKAKQLLEQDSGKGVRWSRECYPVLLNAPNR
jgi:hypothetical protein